MHNILWAKVSSAKVGEDAPASAERFDRPDGVGAADNESGEAKQEHRMAEGGAEVLPEGGTTAGIMPQYEEAGKRETFKSYGAFYFAALQPID